MKNPSEPSDAANQEDDPSTLLRHREKMAARAGSAPTPADRQRAVANLRHLYAQLIQPGWTDAKVEEIARGLLGPAIEILERAER